MSRTLSNSGSVSHPVVDHRLRRRACRLAMSAAMLLTLPTGQATGQPRGLFTTDRLEEATAVSRSAPTSDSPVSRRRVVGIDLGQLTPGAYAAPSAGEGQGTAESLTLNLFDDVAVSATVERTAPTSSGGYSLSGPLDGVEFGTMTLVVNGEIVAGTVHTPLVTYAIRPVGDGVSVVHEVDRAFRCELWDHPWVDPRGSAGDAGGGAVSTFDPVDPAADPTGPVDPGIAASTGSEDGSVIDLLVVYTPAARAGFGGTRQIEAFIDLAVADLNGSLEASGVIQRINLVHRAEVAYTESEGFFGHLISPADGHLDEVHMLRDAYAADLVHLIQAGSFLGGIAQVLGPFGATHYDKLGLLSHELGHSMGLRHDRYNDPSNHPFPYSHGYINQAAFEPGAPYESRFATIMAYNSQCGDAGFFCPWTNTFSNPDMTWNGYPMGVPGDEPSSAVGGPADARRSLNELRARVANFRVRESGPDLVVRSPAVSDPTLEPNQAFTFSAAVGNIGDLPAAASVVTYYRSPAPGITAADTPVGFDTVTAVGPRSTDPVSVSLTAPADPGVYYYGACVQTVGQETAEANNCSWGAWVVVGDGADAACRQDLGTLPVPGSIGRTGAWTGACESTIYYRFTLGRTTRLTIDLTSPSVNTFLALSKLGGAITDRAGDGGGGTNARITKTLEPGSYLIWAVGYPYRVTGPFTLTVVTGDRANRPPEPVGTLPPLALGVGAPAVTVEVSGAFRDPEGDALTYAATSPAPAVAAVAVSGSAVTVMPGAAGTAKITVTATDANGSNTPAIQTFTVAVFTDHPIAAGTTPLRAVHFHELRARIAALRATNGLPAMQWTDPALTAGVTPVRRIHLMELRAALDAVYDAVGRARPSYADATVTAGTTAIRAAHVMELRAFVAALE